MSKKPQPVRLEYVPLRELQKWPRNPKEHDGPSIEASIARWGYIQPIVLDERAGRIVAGHGRLEALTAMRDKGDAPPARIEAKDGDWCVPVLRGVEFKNRAEAEAFLLADNQTTILGGYDDAALAAMLKSLQEEQVPIIGWDDSALASLIEDASLGSPVDLGDAPKDQSEAEIITCPKCGHQFSA